MAPGTIQLHIFSWNTKPARYFKMGQYDEKSIELFQQEGLMIPDTLNFFWVSMPWLVHEHLKRADMFICRSCNLAVN
jgi:hypothetical protein